MTSEEPGAQPSGEALFNELLALSRERLEPGIAVDIVADAFERVAPTLQYNLQKSMMARLEQQNPDPHVREMVETMNEQVVKRIFAKTVTVLRNDKFDRLRRKGKYAEPEGNSQ